MIDQARLKELAADFGDDDLGEIIESFLEETWEALNALDPSTANLSPDELNAQFHFLKGCARNIGAVEFGDHCDQLEMSGTDLGPAEYLHLKAKFQAVCDYFSEGDTRQSA